LETSVNSPYFGRYLIAGVFGLFFVVCAVCNLWLIVRSYWSQTHNSLIPLVGGLSGCLAVLIVPLEFSRWWWVPFVVDPGSALMVFGAVGYAVWIILHRRR
jgi:hypothetical protein